MKIPSLENKTVLIIGRGGGIAGVIAPAVRGAGGRVIAASRDPEALAGAYRGTAAGSERVDVTSVAELAGQVPGGDHVVSTASARARGGYADLAPDLVAVSPAVKAIGLGTIDTGAYDAIGAERKAALFAAGSAPNPRRTGTAGYIAAVALVVLASGFLTGAAIPVDGGEHLV